MIPDPGDFNPMLRKQIYELAQTRMKGQKIDEKTREQMEILAEQDAKRIIMSMPEAALARAELLRAKVENELQINYQGQALKLTISLGAAIYPTHGETPDQILKAADTALYKAKESGRNRALLASG
jgi:GGDEF domain-containing protein